MLTPDVTAQARSQPVDDNHVYSSTNCLIVCP